MAQPPQRKPLFPLTVSLRTLLTIPYILVIGLTVAVVGVISFLNGQAAVNDVAHRLRAEATLRIQQHLIAFLGIPPEINQLSASALESGALNPADVVGLQRHFLEQVKTFPSVTSAYFGTAQGGIVGGGREGAAGAYYVESTSQLQSGTFTKFSVDAAGNALAPLTAVSKFDARVRPWYLRAAERGQATWSAIYILFTGQDMAIAASRPVYDPEHNLIGVVSVDIFLSQLSQYLASLEISPVGQIYIIERTGQLVATSTSEPLFADRNDDGQKERLSVEDSPSALIRASAGVLRTKFGSYQQAPAEPQQLEFTLAGERQFVQYLPVQDPYGIDWIVVLTIPESAFMEQIQANNRITLWIIAAALVVAVGTSVVITPRLTRPISRLEQSTRALAEGQWDLASGAATRIVELQSLALSFSKMKDQLRRTLDDLTVEVAERKRAEAALRERDALLMEAQRIGHFGHAEWTAQRDGVICSDELRRIFDLPPAGPACSKAAFGARVYPEDCRPLASLEPGFLAGRTDLDFEYPIMRPDSQLGWIHQHTKVSYDEAGAPIRAIGVFHDITQQRQAETELRTARWRLENIIEGARIGTWEWNVQTGEANFNDVWAQLVGYTLDELAPVSIKTWEALAHPDDLKRSGAMLEQHFSGTLPYYECVCRLRHKDGSWVWILDRGRLITRTEAGQPLLMFGTHTDITERQQSALHLQALLAEKEVLVKEVHHRVKNNLQVVVSLLGLQADRIQDPAALAVFQDSQERVRAIALVHEKLYQSPDLAHIDFAEYLNELTRNLTQVFQTGSFPLIEVESELIQMGVDLAIPCGLIVNELVINALKYAYPAGRTGRIRVGFATEAAGAGEPRRFRLTVSDDGVGLPDDLDLTQTTSLGLQLVQILARQVHGTLTINRQAGLEFELRFAERPRL